MPLISHTYRLAPEHLAKLGALAKERNQTPGEVIRSLIANARLKNKNSKRILEESAKLRVR